MKKLLGLAALLAATWSPRLGWGDSIQPIVNTKQVLYGSAQKTITSNSDVTVDTTTHLLTANQGVKVTTITFVDGTIIASTSTLGGGGSAAWGSITGTLSNQTDLQTKFNGIATATNTLQSNINSVGAATGTIQTQVNAVVVSTTGLQTQINALVISTAGLSGIYLTQSSATATYVSTITATNTYLTQSSATTTYAPKGGTILNQNTLQNGATFYVSSGTVNGPLVIGGQCTIDGGFLSSQGSFSNVVGETLTNSNSSVGASVSVNFNNGQAGGVNTGQIISYREGSATNGDMAFTTDNTDGSQAPTEKMRILGNGNMGIGTTTPGATLEVNGNLLVDGPGTNLFSTFVRVASMTAVNLSTGMPVMTNSSGTLVSGQVSISTQVYGVLPISNGGSGTSSPALVAGTGISITGSWPAQTINATTSGASALAITTGSILGYSGAAISSPTAVVVFDSNTFNGQLTGSATFFVTINTSSITAQGNSFNSANHLVQLTSGNQYPVSDGNLITNLNAANIAGGVVQNSSSLQSGTTFYVSSGTIAGPLIVGTTIFSPVISNYPSQTLLFQSSLGFGGPSTILTLHGSNTAGTTLIAGGATSANPGLQDWSGVGSGTTYTDALMFHVPSAVASYYTDFVFTANPASKYAMVIDTFAPTGNTPLYLMDVSTTAHLNFPEPNSVIVATVTSCGGGASLTGNDTVGTITTGSGSPTTCTLTFGSAYTNTPVCLCGANGATACDPTNTSNTAVTFTLGVTETTIKYICIGLD